MRRPRRAPTRLWARVTSREQGSAARGERRHPCGGYNVSVQELRDPPPVLLPRWVTPLFTVAAIVLVPWTLWLTFSLPSRHVSQHYDLAWVGFDLALAGVFTALAWTAVRRSPRLIPIAAAAGTMLLCDAWFDVVTSAGGGEMVEAVLEAVFVELPLAALCGFIVYDAETFLEATVHRYQSALRRRR